MNIIQNITDIVNKILTHFINDKEIRIIDKMLINKKYFQILLKNYFLVIKCDNFVSYIYSKDYIFYNSYNKMNETLYKLDINNVINNTKLTITITIENIDYLIKKITTEIYSIEIRDYNDDTKIKYLNYFLYFNNTLMMKVVLKIVYEKINKTRYIHLYI